MSALDQRAMSALTLSFDQLFDRPREALNLSDPPEFSRGDSALAIILRIANRVLIGEGKEQD